jgi:hypothetical protein
VELWWDYVRDSSFPTSKRSTPSLKQEAKDWRFPSGLAMLMRAPYSGELVGYLDIVLRCFNMTSSYANGEGMLCELMAESIVGRYTTIWDDTGFYVYGLGPDGKPL